MKEGEEKRETNKGEKREMGEGNTRQAACCPAMSLFSIRVPLSLIQVPMSHVGRPHIKVNSPGVPFRLRLKLHNTKVKIITAN